MNFRRRFGKWSQWTEESDNRRPEKEEARTATPVDDSALNCQRLRINNHRQCQFTADFFMLISLTAEETVPTASAIQKEKLNVLVARILKVGGLCQIKETIKCNHLDTFGANWVKWIWDRPLHSAHRIIRSSRPADEILTEENCGQRRRKPLSGERGKQLNEHCLLLLLRCCWLVLDSTFSE